MPKMAFFELLRSGPSWLSLKLTNFLWPLVFISFWALLFLGGDYNSKLSVSEFESGLIRVMGNHYAHMLPRNSLMYSRHKENRNSFAALPFIARIAVPLLLTSSDRRNGYAVTPVPYAEWQPEGCSHLLWACSSSPSSRSTPPPPPLPPAHFKPSGGIPRWAGGVEKKAVFAHPTVAHHLVPPPAPTGNTPLGVAAADRRHRRPGRQRRAQRPHGHPANLHGELAGHAHPPRPGCPRRPPPETVFLEAFFF